MKANVSIQFLSGKWTFEEKITNSNAVLMILTFAVAISFNKINLDSVKSIWRLVFGRVFRCATALHLFTSCRSQCKLWLGFHLTNWQWRNHRQRREENTLLLLPCAANVSPQLIAPLCQITALQSCSDKQTNQNRIPANTLRLKIIFIFECVEIEWHFFCQPLKLFCSIWHLSCRGCSILSLFVYFTAQSRLAADWWLNYWY